MDAIFAVGIVAAFCTTVSYVPQVIKAHKTRHTKDLSLMMLVMLTIGIGLWAVYGVMLNSAPIIVANSTTLVLSCYLLYLKIKYG